MLPFCVCLCKQKGLATHKKACVHLARLVDYILNTRRRVSCTHPRGVILDRKPRALAQKVDVCVCVRTDEGGGTSAKLLRGRIIEFTCAIDRAHHCGRTDDADTLVLARAHA